AQGGAGAGPDAGEAPGPTVAAEPLPRPPAPAADLILDLTALAALVARITAAGEVGVAVLADGPYAMRADLVGVAFVVPGAGADAGADAGPTRAYLPLCHRYLGVPACLREADALGALAPVLAAETIRKHIHDAKTAEVLLRRRGLRLGGLASDPMIAAYLLDASRTRYDLDVVA